MAEVNFHQVSFLWRPELRYSQSLANDNPLWLCHCVSEMYSEGLRLAKARSNGIRRLHLLVGGYADKHWNGLRNHGTAEICVENALANTDLCDESAVNWRVLDTIRHAASLLVKDGAIERTAIESAYRFVDENHCVHAYPIKTLPIAGAIRLKLKAIMHFDHLRLMAETWRGRKKLAECEVLRTWPSVNHSSNGRYPYRNIARRLAHDNYA